MYATFSRNIIYYLYHYLDDNSEMEDRNTVPEISGNDGTGLNSDGDLALGGAFNEANEDLDGIIKGDPKEMKRKQKSPATRK